MRSPGWLDELGPDGQEAWAARVTSALGKLGAPTTPADPDAPPEHRSVDWPGYPARIGACLGRDRALALLDWTVAGVGDLGRLRHQEEYLEWRVVREGDRPRRIEMTTELSDYWEVLAAHEPDRTIELVSSFARERVHWREVYTKDPNLPSATPESRAKSFAKRMLFSSDDRSRSAVLRVSPYNTGERALCCMLHPSNTLGALLHLALRAMRHGILIEDPVTGRTRYPSGSEAISMSMGNAAQDGRNSDPVIVEHLVRLVTEGRTVGLDDPIGIAIRGVQRSALAQPNGDAVPEEWFTFGRGLRADEAPDGRQRCQRLTLEVPVEAGFVDDLIVRRTGERLRFGGQLAALVQLGVFLRTGPVGSVPEVLPLPSPAPASPDCGDALTSFAEMETTIA